VGDGRDFPLAATGGTRYQSRVRSFFGMLLVLLVFVLVVGGGGLIWHLSSNVEFSRKDVPAAAKR
jgi:flagellar basal body-associated protein FliL